MEVQLLSKELNKQTKHVQENLLREKFIRVLLTASVTTKKVKVQDKVVFS